MSSTVEVPGVGEGVLIDPPTPPRSHAHQHSVGHDHQHGGHGGHGHHSHDHKAEEDQWDGDAYVERPGAKEVALVSADRVLWALQQTGLTAEDIKRIDLLEVGCGPGLVTTQLIPHFSSIHAIDVSPSMLLTFASRHSSPLITHSLHFLSPDSSKEFTTPLLSPLPSEQSRRLVPPRQKYGAAVANLVLHHVDNWEGMMNGLRGLLADGGWFVGTEFGREEGGKDVVQEARKKVAAEKLKEEAAVGSSEETPETKVPVHGHIHHGAMTPSEMYVKLKSMGFDEAHAEIRGEMNLWPNTPPVPCLVFWARKGKA